MRRILQAREESAVVDAAAWKGYESVKTQYLKEFGVVTFYWDRPFSIAPYTDDGIDLFPNK